MTLRSRPATTRAIGALVAAALMGLAVLVAPPHGRVEAQSLPAVSGAGSTWSQNALEQWAADVSRQGLRVNYQGNGSTAGRTLFTQGQVDFAVSEIPYQRGETKPSGAFVYLPIVAGGTAIMYQVTSEDGRRIENLRLSSKVIAQIFTLEVKKWTDPAIEAENPGVNLPDKDITVVVRSDGSGTSYQFSAYLANQQPNMWAAFARDNNIPAAPTSNWPTLTGATGQAFSDGVANYVARGDGAITYVEASYAKERSVPVVAVRNKAGSFTVPTAQAVAIALTKARINPDRTQVLDGVYNTTDAGAYPISSYSYMLARTSGISADKGRVIARFVYYFACRGQRAVGDNGYSPLPPNLVRLAFEAIVTTPGAEPPPKLTPADCPNPQITGDFGGVGGGQTTTTTTTTQPGGGGGGNGGGGGGTGGGGGGTGGGETGTTDHGAGTQIDLDGDGQADAVDLDGDGIADQTIDGEQIAAASDLDTPDGAVRVRGGGGSGVPLGLAALAIVLLVLAPPLLLSSGSPGRKLWHRAFGED